MDGISRVLLIDGDATDRQLASLVIAGARPELSLMLIEDSLAFAEALARAPCEVLIVATELPWADPLTLVETTLRVHPRCQILVLVRESSFVSDALAQRVAATITKTSAGWLELPKALSAAIDDYRRATTGGTTKQAMGTEPAVTIQLPGDAQRPHPLSRTSDVSAPDMAERTHASKDADTGSEQKQLSELAILAHDFKEPLRTMIRFSARLKEDYDDKLDSDGRDYLAFVNDASDRLLTQITALLEPSSEIKREQKTGAKPTTQCDHVLEKTLINLTASIEASGAVITSSSLPHVDVNPEDMLQLLQNLISNAIKFRRDEAPRIHISALREDSQWVFAVEDNGLGIADRDRERIFSMFQRAHVELGPPGSGMGLAVCKRIVEHHGGRIWVDTTPGRGSTFRFTLPVSSEGNDA